MRAGSRILYNHSDVPMFPVDPEYYQNQVVSKFGNFDSVIFDEPTIIQSETVNHFMKKLCPDTKKLFEPDQIVLVFELRNTDQPSSSKQSKGQSILDYNWWTNQNIRSIVVLQQPLQRRNASVYAVTDPFEYHYESYIVDVLNALRGTDLTMIFHPIGINSRSAHSIVVNKQSDLQGVIALVNIREASYLVNQFPSKYQDENGVRRDNHNVHDGGFCSGQNIGCSEEGQYSFDLLEEHIQEMIKKLCIATPRLHAGAHTNEAQRQMILLSTLFYWLVGEHVHISPLQYI